MLLLVACLLLSAVPMVQAADDYNPLHAELTGPMVVSAGEKQMYVLTMVGGPAEVGQGNYSYTAKVTGDAVLSPSSGSPKTTGRFYMNLTAPEETGTVTITVTCKSAGSLQSVTNVIVYKVKVVEPVVIKATIQNTGNVNVTDVPVTLQLYQDDAWTTFYETTVDVGAGKTTTFWYNWTALDLGSGEHKVRLLLDANNTIVTFEGGSSVYETTIYNDMSGYGTINTIMWLLIIVMVVILFFLWRRPVKGKKKR
jgi:hypothetical protein